MSRIPSLIQAELIGVPLYLHKTFKKQSPQEQRIAVLEMGVWKAYLTLKSMSNVFTDSEITAWKERLENLLNYPGTPWNSSRRLETLEEEIKHGIDLLESSIRSPVLKRLHDFLIAVRAGNICEYYQQISKEEEGLIVKFSLESDYHKQEDCL